VNILDENIPKNQKELLETWRVHVKQIGFDIGRKGMLDDEIITFLLQLRRPTFFTRDDDFYARQLCHARYCLVYLSVEKYEAAFFTRRFLRHRELKTQAGRMGCVVRVSAAGIWLWRLHAEKEERLSWV
jgi:hypothetical protein